MRWFTSDTHFAKTGDKILRREMRPYKTIKEYCDDQIRIWDGAKLYLVHRPIDCKPGMLNLYGHVHRQGGIWSPYGFNICTDVNHFRLYSENDIRFLISQKAAWDNDADTKFLAGIK